MYYHSIEVAQEAQNLHQVNPVLLWFIVAMNKILITLLSNYGCTYTKIVRFGQK